MPFETQCNHASHVAFERNESPDCTIVDEAEVGPIRQFLEVAQGDVQTFIRGRGLTMDRVLGTCLGWLPDPAGMKDDQGSKSWDVTIWGENRLLAAIITSTTPGVPHKVVKFGRPDAPVREVAVGGPGAGAEEEGPPKRSERAGVATADSAA